MKNIHLLKSLLPIFFWIYVLTVSAQTTDGRKVIVIDPGHGGNDPGAIGVNKSKEKDVVLDLAQRILQLNEAVGKYEIYLTRYTDTLISLKDRTTLAKTLGADLFISLHCNYSNSKSAKGMEIFVAAGHLSELKATSVLTAHAIYQDVTATTGIFGRGIKFSNFQVLRETANFAPSILIELFFLTNPEESEYLSKPKHLEQIASLILNNL